MEKVTLKQVGQNITIVVDDVVTTRKIADKEERESIKATVAAFNEKPLKKHQTAIEKFVKAKGNKEEAKGALTGSKGKIAKEVVKKAKEKPASKKEQIKAGEAKKEEKAIPVRTATTGRTGEW